MTKQQAAQKRKLLDNDCNKEASGASKLSCGVIQSEDLAGRGGVISLCG